MNELPYDTAVAPEPVQYPVDTGAPVETPLAPTLAATRAYKIGTANDIANKSYDQVYRDLVVGKEMQLRQQLAADRDIQRSLDSQRLIAEVARKKGSGLTAEDLTAISTYRPPSDPASIVEEQYAKKYVSALDYHSTQIADALLTRARKDAPQETQQKVEQTDIAGAKIEFTNTMQENALNAKEKQSWFGYFVDQAKLFSQIYQEVKLRGLVKGTGVTEGGFLGSHLEAASLALLQKPLPEFKAEFQSIVEALNRDNPDAALMFIQAVKGQSTGDKFLQNVMTPLVLTGVGTAASVAKGVKRSVESVKLAKEVDKALTDVLKTMDEPTKFESYGTGVDSLWKAPKVAEVAGNIEEAAIQQTKQTIVKQLKGSSNPVIEAKEALQSVFTGQVDAVKSNPGPFRQELINRITENLTTAKNNFMDVLTNVAKVERLPGILKIEQAVREIADNIKDSYPGIRNQVIQVATPTKDPLTNLYHVDVLFGNKGATAFKSSASAEKFASLHGLKGAIVEQKGQGFYVKMTNTLKETDDVIRKWTATTNETKTPDSMLTYLGGWLGSARTPEDVLSMRQNLNRKIATYGPSNIFKVLEDSAAEIAKLKRGSSIPFSKKRQRWQDWQEVVDEAKFSRDPATGAPYYKFQTPQEFADLYHLQKGRLPDDQEVAAYFAHVNLEHMNDFLIKREKFKNLSRDGVATYTIRAADLSRETAKNIPFLERTLSATKLTEYPKGSDTLLFVKGTDAAILTTTDGIKGDLRKSVIKDIEEGKLFALRIANPGDYPLEGWGKVRDERVRYVITDHIDHKPLSWQDVKVNRTADYDYDFYIGQAKMRLDTTSKKNWYEGDSTIAAFNIGAMGRDVAARLDKVRQLLKANKIDEARAANPLPDFEEVQGWFKTRDVIGADGGVLRTVPGRLSLDERIQLIPRHQRIHDLNNELKDSVNARLPDSFTDGTREGFGRNIDSKPDPYDIFTMSNTGTRANPLYNVEPVKAVNPVTSINRALKRSVESSFMNDYKIFSVEHWIKEAAPHMGVSPAQLAEAPFYYFHHPEWKSGDKARIANLETARFQIQQFMGVHNALDNFLHLGAQKLADSLYERTGKPNIALTPTYALPFLRDPFNFIRSVTFHEKIGLWAIPQLMVQSQTFSAIFGIAGAKYAAPGTRAAMLHQWSRLNRNPEILDHMDKLASEGKFLSPALFPGHSRWRPGEWLEAYHLLNRTGFANVAGEHIFRDNPHSYDIISSGKNKILDAGTIFFRGAERNVRYGAWYTAFREFRDKVPHGRITDDDLATILNRADTLSINMSRASASTLQRGVFSVASQFYSYQLRMAELFFGKGRLLPHERARLLGYNAALYGVPTSLGVTGFPFVEYIQQKAREQGYIVGEKWGETLFHEGLPSLLIGLATGNYYNIPQRYGSGGQNPISESLRSDHTFWDTIGGAAGSTFANTLANADGLIQSTISMIKGGDEKHPYKIDDFKDMFLEVSVIKNNWQFYEAVRTHKWFSKKEAYLEDTSVANALFMYLSGLQPESSIDAHLTTIARKSEKEYETAQTNLFIKEYRRMLQAADNNDTEQTKDYHRRATWYIQKISEENRGKAVSMALKDYEKLAERVGRKFLIEDVPPHRKAIAEDMYIRSLKLREGK